MDNNNNERELREEYRKRLEEQIYKNAHEEKTTDHPHHEFHHRPHKKPRTDRPTPPPVPEKHHFHTPKWMKALIWLLIILVIGGGFYEYHKVHKMATGVFSDGNGKISKKLQQGKPVSVLAMGTDVGALHRGNAGGNTDSIELFTINPKTQRITMTSIPRDTLVRVNTDDGADYVKINAAYSIGGPKQTVKQVSELLDVPIDYYAVINMGVLKKVVNSLGGVEVDNPFAFTYEGHHFKKGKQHLNGNEALKYSRMRYQDPNNDYGRQKRQQQILSNVIKKFKKSGSISSANKIMDAVGDGIKTNIPIDDIATLYGNYHSAMNSVTTYHFQGQDAMIDGAAFQIASPKEINRVSKLVRKELSLKPKKVVNHETKMYKSQPNYNGYNKTDFILPAGASYNDPGSGNGSDYVTSSSRRSSSDEDDENNSSRTSSHPSYETGYYRSSQTRYGVSSQ
ncbi:LCP family protein [Limosilactobacillus sp.]|uniref:LCP family protein n=1 Tax=Limosilactobacillus sp. TaxID=2773925 RepID=UPI00345ECEDE